MTLCSCGCGRPVFKGDDGICESCVREHRTELLEACKKAEIILRFAPILGKEEACLDEIQAAIAKADGGGS